MVTYFHDPDSMENKASGDQPRWSYRMILKRLSHLLDCIKYFPWFSVLLILILGWQSYQVKVRQGTWNITHLQNSFQGFSKKVHSALVGLLPKEKPIESEKIALPEKRVDEDLKSVQEITPEQIRIEFEVYKKRMEHLEKRLEDTQAELAQLDELKSGLSEIDNIKTQFSHVQNALHAQSQELSGVNDKIESLPEESTSSSHESIKGYSVYATTEGLAWLNTPQGQLVTKRVGDCVPTLGKIQRIDTKNTLIYFDEGHAIGPSESDS